MKEEVHKVLWTSGWDSTYRVVELVLKGAVIQPYYVIDKKRVSYRKEIDTLALLRAKIVEAYPDAKDRLLEVIFIDLKKIKPDILCKVSHKVLKNRGHIGKQYYWLACLSKRMDDLELCLAADDFAILKFLGGKIVVEEHPFVGAYYKLSPDVKDFFLKRIFKDLRFPTIGLTKLDMKAIAEQKGFIAIMNATWFCQNATDKPCKTCHICQLLVKNGMGYRLDM